MTKAHILKNFFKKYFNYDASGNSPIQVLSDVMDNVDDLGGGGGGNGTFEIIFTFDGENFSCNKTKDEIVNEYIANGDSRMVAKYEQPLSPTLTSNGVLIKMENDAFAGLSTLFFINTEMYEDDGEDKIEFYFVLLLMDASGNISYKGTEEFTIPRYYLMTEIDSYDESLDSTWQEIYDAFPYVYITYEDDSSEIHSKIMVTECSQVGNNYYVLVSLPNHTGLSMFVTDSPNGQPTLV